MLAACGETPWPQITCWRRLAAMWRMIGASPPGPFRCGSATCRVKAAATAASKALPPRSSTAMPTWLASQCVLATTPNVPAISGRVVNMRHALLVARSSGRLCDDCVRLKWSRSSVANPPPVARTLGEGQPGPVRRNVVFGEFGSIRVADKTGKQSAAWFSPTDIAHMRERWMYGSPVSLAHALNIACTFARSPFDLTSGATAVQR